jgi:SAM-dependent methyltransferase
MPAGYFDAMYAASPDPWGFRDRWYEQRKRAVTTAALPRARYTRAFEPGCSIGVLTADLAGRCDAVVAGDPSDAAVLAAREALAGQPHVTVERMTVPEDWPPGWFDLVVLSEVAYYLDPAAIDRLAERCLDSLTEGGTLLACHWRHPVADYPVGGDEVHARLAARPELHPLVHHVETDFVLDVWSLGAVPSVAEAGGLVG